MASAAATVDVPSHIAADRVVDFDFYRDPRFSTADIHTALAGMLRQVPPVFWTPRNGGHWVIAGHEELFEASRRPDIFSSKQLGIPRSPYEPVQIPIKIDPPDHARYREPLSRAFAPRAMLALEDDIRALAAELIDQIRPLGRCDFTPAVAEPLPVTIFMRMMGLPLDQLGRYRTWVYDILASGDPERKGAAARKVMAAMTEIITQRMARRENDLISRLLDTPIAGRPITLDEMQSYCMLLFTAGLDTVTNAMCFGVLHLADHPDLQARLRADPARITDAMEESLRRYAMVQPGRVLARDAEILGVTFRKDDMVLMMLPGAGIDGRAFADPLAFVVDREDKAHITFNAGPHRCVGSHLARIELRVLYEELLARLPPFRRDPDQTPRIHGGQVIGFESLPLVWDPD